MKIFPAAVGGFAAVLVALTVQPAFSQQRADDFAAACIKRGVRESACVCQAKIARASLNAAERRAAIAAMTGGREAMQRELTRMGEAKAKVFASKMQRLGQEAKARCA